jgi:hypothetical protein
MVTPSLKKVFEAENVGLIPLQAGAEYLVRECNQAGGAVEVVVLAGEALPAAPVTPPAVKTSPLTPAFERELNLEQYPFLRSHVIDGRAVLPMAVILEWLAHGALHGNPGLVFHGFNDLRILKGVFLGEGRPCTVRILAGRASRQGTDYVVPVEMHGFAGNGREMTHNRAEIVLVSRLPRPEGGIPEVRVNPYRRAVREVYDELLFHGPMLQGLERIEGCSAQGAVSQVTSARPPAEWMQQPLRGTWLADPLVLDSAFQLMVVWSFDHQGAASLPCFAGRYRQYRRSFPADGVRVVAAVTRESAHRALANLVFVDRSGEVIARLEDYECVIDTSLNQAFRRNQLAQEVLPSA